MGYREDFLEGLVLPIPGFSNELSHEVLRNGEVFDYPNYSVVMNKETDKRSPVIVCLNIDQNKLHTVKRKDNWRYDKGIGPSNQLGEDYYYKNPWDKGHMARRANAAHGDSYNDAQYASDETFYYSNAALQHANLNQDEWLGLEQWVLDLNLDADGKITSFTGPIYGDHDRTIRPGGLPTALIPSGFYKVVCFINKETNALDVRSFVMYQDEEALRSRNDGFRYNNQTYQVTISEIEELTGLRFDRSIYDANPLYFTSRNAQPSENVSRLPESVEVAKPDDILAKGDARQTIDDDIVDIFITAAMVDPSGPDKGSEWVSLTNLGDKNIDVSGWKLLDNSEASLTIGGDGLQTYLRPGDSLRIDDVSPLKLSNKGDVIKLYRQTGERVDWVNYTEKMVKPGKPVVFLTPRDTLEV